MRSFFNRFAFSRSTEKVSPDIEMGGQAPTDQMMEVMRFQLQVSSGNALQFMRKIDKSVPIPQPLEGGDGNGCLYECILDSTKINDLVLACKKQSTIRVYTSLTELQLPKELYRPDYYVHWNFGKEPTVSAEQY